MGQQSNETSGKAIDARQRQGENSTYHFICNQGHAIRFTGKIIVDLIPKIYDTARVMKILAEDGTSSDVNIDPAAQAAYQQHINRLTGAVAHIFNPSVGKYDVEADIGPAYGTRRQEAFNAFEQIVTRSPALTSVVGDLMFKNADFPGADEIADRLRRLVPPQALGEGPNPALQQLQGMVQNMQKANTALMEELATAKMQLKHKDTVEEIDEYRAITDRIKALLPTMVNPKDIAQNIVDTMRLEKQNAHEMSKLQTQAAFTATQQQNTGVENALPQGNTPNLQGNGGGGV